MRRLALLALVVVSACSGSDPPADPEPPTCEPGIRVPIGFEPLGSFEEPYADHVGVRLGYRDADERELHLLVGIPGEYGEAMTSLGDLPLAGDRTGVLFSGIEGVWTVVWEQGDRCDPRAVIGNGFTREAFLDALEESRLTERRPTT
ncbi:MAG: hypothetical protein ACXWX6_05180 [Actinomycetota bacterium]